MKIKMKMKKKMLKKLNKKRNRPLRRMLTKKIQIKRKIVKANKLEVSLLGKQKGKVHLVKSNKAPTL